MPPMGSRRSGPPPPGSGGPLTCRGPLKMIPVAWTHCGQGKEFQLAWPGKPSDIGHSQRQSAQCHAHARPDVMTSC
jgi:hypothetical protein